MPGELKLYYDFISQPSRALYILLKVSGKSFEAHTINLLEGEHWTDEFKNEINRFQKLPAIIDGTFKLAESIAILRYLIHRGYISSEFYPNDLKQRAHIDEFLSWQHNGIRSSCSLYFRFNWVQSRLMGTPAELGKVEKYKRDMERDLQSIEDIWLKNTKFLAGDQLTAADVFGACEIEQIRTMGYNVSEKYPKLANWIETVRQQLAPHFDIAHQTVYLYEKEWKARL